MVHPGAPTLKAAVASKPTIPFASMIRTRFGKSNDFSTKRLLQNPLERNLCKKARANKRVVYQHRSIDTAFPLGRSVRTQDRSRNALQSYPHAILRNDCFVLPFRHPLRLFGNNAIVPMDGASRRTSLHHSPRVYREKLHIKIPSREI